jgi:hypothetical protein
MMISMICMNLLRDSVGSAYHHFHRDDKQLFLHDYMLINIINKNAEGQVNHMTLLNIIAIQVDAPHLGLRCLFPPPRGK